MAERTPVRWFSSSVYSIIITVTAGLRIGLLNMGLSQTGYVSPPLTAASQSTVGVRPDFLHSGNLRHSGYYYADYHCYLFFFDLEKKLPGIHEIHRKPETAGL